MDIKSFDRWDDYTRARDEMFAATDTAWAPWCVARSEDKKRVRLNVISHLLKQIPYKAIPAEKVKLPKRTIGKYKSADYPFKFVEEKFSSSPWKSVPAGFPKEESRMKHRTRWMLALAAAAVTQAAAQQYVYPAKGQSAQQQKSDEAACQTWAIQQTGFDPAKPPPPQAAAAPPTTATGTTPGAGMKGAARGAVVGEVVGGDAGAGAAAGAAVARSQSRKQNAAAAQQGQQQAQAATQQQQAAFAKARAACLEGRGYTVK